MSRIILTEISHAITSIVVQVDFQLDAKRLMLADDAGEFHPHIGEWTLEVQASRPHQHKVSVTA